MSRKVLVLTYEFPPSGGGGVQRVAKFARYLSGNGWEPLVVCAEHVPGRPLDQELYSEVASVPVLRTPARRANVPVARVLTILQRVRGLLPRRRRATTPAAAGPATRGAAAAPSTGAVVGRTARITALIAFPDVAAYWVGPAVRAAVSLGRREKVAAVFASGPPHSVLIAGSRVAKALGVPFVADMRDAWRDNPGAHYPTRFHRDRAPELERRVMAAAAAVTCVSEPIAREAREMGARDVVVLPNGFDPADVPEWAPEPGDLHIAFMGQMYSSHSDPAPLLDAMNLAGEASATGSRVIFDVIGSAAPFAVDEVAARGLQDRVRFLGYHPHAEALRLLARADVGVVLIRDVPGSKASYTGKIFEYLGMGIPVLVVGPVDGVAADLVREAGSGRVAAYGDPADCARVLVELAEAKARGEGAAAPAEEVVRRFDRSAQAAVLASVLDRVAAR
jgi:glycosyltransferase involved in cell wall biosynthesis